MKRKWLFRLCASFLILALMPGTAELVENAAHMVTEGHLAHATLAETAGDGDPHGPSGPEHGCTPTLHLCGCHITPTAVGSSAPPSLPMLDVGYLRPAESGARIPGFQPAIERPPQV